MTIVPIRYVEPVYRPPSEADSLILPVTDGCSWNRCTFCEMYTAPQKRFRPRSEEEVLESIRRLHSESRRQSRSSSSGRGPCSSSPDCRVLGHVDRTDR